MTASFRYVLRNLGRRRTRSVVGVLGIFLTIAFLTAVQIGLDSVSTSYTDLVALQAGKADLIITTEGGTPLNPAPFDPTEAEERTRDNPHLRGLSPRLAGIVQVSAGGQEHYAALIGIDAARERELDISGLIPEPALDAGSGSLSPSLAAKLSASAGSNVVVRSLAFGTTKELKVESLLQRQLIVPQEVRDYIVVGKSDARQVLGERERVHALAGAFHNPRSYYDARDLHASVLRLKSAGEGIAADLGMAYNVRLPKAAAITAFQNFTAPVRALFGVMALLALSITGLLIYSLISVAVEERIREYAILRTLGARRRSIFGLVLSESLLLCFLGVFPGVLAGMLVAAGIVKLVGLAVGAQGGAIAVEFSPAILWLTLLIGVALSIGSALVPAMRAVRWRIVDALAPFRRGQVPAGERVEGGVNRPLLVTGLVLSALAGVVFFVLPTAFLSGNPSLIGAVMLCLLLTLLLGFTLVAIGALPLIQRLVMSCIGRLFGPAAEMAGRNLERNRRRNVITALMFALSVCLVIFIASLVSLFSRTSMAMVEHIYGADIRLHSGERGAENVKGELARIEGVANASEVLSLHSRSQWGTANDVIISDLVGLKHLWIVPFGVDANLTDVLYTHQVQFDEGNTAAFARLADDQAAASNNAPGADHVPPLILSLSAARYLEVGVGDLVQLTFLLGSARRDQRFRIEAVCSAMPGFDNFRSRVAAAVGSGALMSLATFQSVTRQASREAFQARYFVRADGDAEAQKTVARRIREEFDVRYQFGVQSAAEQKEQARALYWVTQVLFGLLLAVAVIISVFALIASMATTVIERRWEVGVLKALGLRRGQLFRMFLGEAVVLTLSAGIAGGAIGFLLAYLFVLQAAALIEMRVIFTMPYVTFMATFAICLAAGAVAAWLPTRRVLQRPAAEILRLET